MIKRMFKSLSFWIVVCLVLGLSGLGAKRIIDSKSPNNIAEAEPLESQLLPVRVVAARRGTIREWIYGEGTARPVRRKFMNFGQSGDLVRVGTDAEGNELREGSRVSGPGAKGETGQLLAQLDQRDALESLSLTKTALQEEELQVTIAEAQVKQVERDFELAKTDFERVKGLKSKNMISIAEYETAQNKLLSAETAITTQQANLQSARLRVKNARSRLRQTELALEQTSLFAPFDGIIARLNVHAGDYVNAHAMNTSGDDAMLQTAAIVIIDPSEYEIELHLPAFAAPAVEVGQSVLIRPGSEGFSGEANSEYASGVPLKRVLLQGEVASEKEETLIVGRIYSVSPSFTEQGRSFLVKVRVTEGVEHLKDGIFVSCRIVVQEKQDVVLIPTKSVFSRENERFVFLADADTGTVTKQQISGGIESPLGETEVLDGLEAGELVVVNQRDRLTDGTKVNILQ